MIRYVCDRCRAEAVDAENAGNMPPTWFAIVVDHNDHMDRVVFCSGTCAGPGLEAIAATLTTHNCGAAHDDDDDDDDDAASTRPPKGN